MPVKMRLQRFGKKGKPFYHVVIADGRAPRNGKIIEKIGTYNPTSSPAQINIEFDAALNWLQKGAQPTDTVKAILSYKGVLYKYHLIKGMKKGALTEDQVEERFQTWLTDKEARIEAKAQGIKVKGQSEADARLEEETKVREAREAVFAKKRAVIIEAEAKVASEKAAEKAVAEKALAEKVAEKAAEKATAEKAAAEKVAAAPAKAPEATAEETKEEVKE